MQNGNTVDSARVGKTTNVEIENENDLALEGVIEYEDAAVGAEVLLVNEGAEFGIDTDTVDIAVSTEATREELETTETIESTEEIETTEGIESTEESTEDIEEAVRGRQIQNVGGVGLRGQPVYVGKRRDRSRILCKKCGRAYYHRSSLARHLRHECGTRITITCPICGIIVKHVHTLKKHLHFKHPGYDIETEKAEES
nr:unnamed protein product [Callosobruchus chinensis]